MRLPIVQHHWPSPTCAKLAKAVNVAKALGKEIPSLKMPSQFDAVSCKQLDDAPTLHIDDYSEIPLPDRQRHAIYMQQRACLRAAPGDWIVTSHPVDPNYETYFQQQLQIQPLNWIVANSLAGPTRLALSCIRSREARRQLQTAIRRNGLRYIHPHLASFEVWQLAAWLHEFTRMPLEVIGPPAEVCRFANDKIEFANLVERLLGKRYVPRTVGAYCVATLSDAVRQLAAVHPALGVKIPNGVGGHGNFFVDSKEIQGKTLHEIHHYLRKRFGASGISTSGRMLVDVWETEVLKSGSVQTWLPPVNEGPPVIEGLFEQLIEGEQGCFGGSRQLEAPSAAVQQIVDQSYLLTTVFQHLGYVGRCSFDFILLGKSLDHAHVEYIECNGRWGGTSAPMTLVNTLLGNYSNQRTFETGRRFDPSFPDMTFSGIARQMGEELYDARTGKGNTVLFNPARAAIRSEIEFVRWTTKAGKNQETLAAKSTRTNCRWSRENEPSGNGATDG